MQKVKFDEMKVIKIGGKLVEDTKILGCLCKKLSAYYPDCVLIHGGGSMAAQLSLKLGVEVKMHEGRRITDAATLEIAVMAYAGMANKKIVACLQACGVNACGLSGCDMDVIRSDKRKKGDMDWGYVGDIREVNTGALVYLLKAKVMPVISPITYDKTGQLLNTNADSVASAVACSLSRQYATELVFCFDKPGVMTDLEDENTVIPFMNRDLYEEYLQKGLIHSGMVPKLENAFRTLASGIKSVRLTHPQNLEGGTLIAEK